jgi:hypothetical protein
VTGAYRHTPRLRRRLCSSRIVSPGAAFIYTAPRVLGEIGPPVRGVRGASDKATRLGSWKSLPHRFLNSLGMGSENLVNAVLAFVASLLAGFRRRAPRTLCLPATHLDPVGGPKTSGRCLWATS